MVEIYLVQNMINGKVYVGQTRQGTRRRWKHHVADAKLNRYPTSSHHSAIRKYGESSFKVRVLSQTENEIEGNELEKFWITQIFQSHLPKNGYNQTKGGIGMQFPTDAVRKRMSSKTSERMKKAWKKPGAREKFQKWTKETSPRLNKNVDTKNLIKLYEEGLSVRQIAKKLEIGFALIYERLWTAGYKLRTRSQAKRLRDAS